VNLRFTYLRFTYLRFMYRRFMYLRFLNRRFLNRRFLNRDIAYWDLVKRRQSCGRRIRRTTLHRQGSWRLCGKLRWLPTRG
jgi:hypothetical protein